MSVTAVSTSRTIPDIELPELDGLSITMSARRTSGGREEIVGESAPLRRALSRVERVAATDSTVLLLGPTGTGKELFARALHALSPRRSW